MGLAFDPAIMGLVANTYPKNSLDEIFMSEWHGNAVFPNFYNSRIRNLNQLMGWKISEVSYWRMS